MSEKKDLPGLITGLAALLATASFVILGFTTRSWQSIWLVFLVVPLTAIITDIIFKKKDIAGTLTGLVAILAAVAYFILGFLLHLWHPGWLVFLSIPLTAVILDLVTKRKNTPDAVVGFVAILASVTFLVLGFFLHIWHIAWVVFLLIPMTAIITNIVKTAGKPSEEDKKDA